MIIKPYDILLHQRAWFVVYTGPTWLTSHPPMVYHMMGLPHDWCTTHLLCGQNKDFCEHPLFLPSIFRKVWHPCNMLSFHNFKGTVLQTVSPAHTVVKNTLPLLLCSKAMSARYTVYSTLYTMYLNFAHCPKNNFNLRIEPEPVKAGADAMFAIYLAQKPDIYRCIHFSRDTGSVSILWTV